MVSPAKSQFTFSVANIVAVWISLSHGYINASRLLQLLLCHCHAAISCVNRYQVLALRFYFSLERGESLGTGLLLPILCPICHFPFPHLLLSLTPFFPSLPSSSPSLPLYSLTSSSLPIFFISLPLPPSQTPSLRLSLYWQSSWVHWGGTKVRNHC